LKNGRVPVNHTRVGWQKEGRGGADYVAEAGNYHKDTEDAGDKTGSPNKYAEGK
jgi:hypothetical protein